MYPYFGRYVYSLESAPVDLPYLYQSYADSFTYTPLNSTLWSSSSDEFIQTISGNTSIDSKWSALTISDNSNLFFLDLKMDQNGGGSMSTF